MGIALSRPATAEWRAHWYLPLVAGLGYATASLQSHTIGPFIEPLQQEFGWTRAQITSGITICNLLLFCLAMPIGVLVDRWGPRRVALFGVVLMPAAFGLLGTATGSVANWLLLWLLIGVAVAWSAGNVWTKAVTSRFDAGRGLAIAVTVSGGSVGVMIMPVIATWLIQTYGWRTAFGGIGIVWALIAFPLIFLFFHGAAAPGPRAGEAAPTDDMPGLRLRDGLRMPAFYALLLAGGCFTFCGVGLLIHLVPIMTHNGASPMTAAVMASIAGGFAIVGRLGTGVLLDRLPGHLVGAAAYSLPILSCALLLTNGEDPLSQVVASAIFGLTLGAEMDVLMYLAARYFGLRNLGVMFGAIVSACSLGLAFGPLAAGAIYDHFNSYAAYLVLTMVLMGLSSIALVSLGRTPAFSEAR